MYMREPSLKLIYLNELSHALMKRIRSNYRFVVGFNSGLIGLGLLGIITPATSALLHNASTIALGIRSLSDLKDEKQEKEKY